jgi:hypothetical protein
VAPGAAFFPDVSKRDMFGTRGQSIFLPYGNPEASEFEIAQGDGAHVGTVIQALNRFMSMFEWIHNRWPNGDYSPIFGAFNREDGLVFFDSERFGKMYRFGISLPPGYGDPAIRSATRSCSCSTAMAWGPRTCRSPAPSWPRRWPAARGRSPSWSSPRASAATPASSSATMASTTTATARWTAPPTAPCAANAIPRPTASGPTAARTGGAARQDLQFCGPPDADCGNNREGHTEGAAVTLCSDGIDNDRDGRADIEDQGCLGDPAQDTEADCKQGGFYTQHVAAPDGSPGGPDFEGAMLDMLDYLDTNYRTKRAETLMVPR